MSSMVVVKTSTGTTLKTGTFEGIVMVLGAAVLWGTTGTAQSLGPADLSPYWVGALRLSIASLFFAVFVWCRSGRKSKKQFARLPWRWVLLGGLCIAGYNLTFFAGVKASSVAVGTALAIGSGPIWAGLLQILISGRAPAWAWWAGTLLAVSGGSLMVLGSGGYLDVSPAGVMLCLAAGLVYAVYVFINKRLVGRFSPALVTLCVFSSASLFAIPAALVLSGTFTATITGWAVAGYLGIIATGVSYVLFSSGLRPVSGATGVTLALAEPLTAFVLAIVVVHEAPATAAFFGLALVLAGLALVVWTEMKTIGA